MGQPLPDSIWSKDDLKEIILQLQTYARWFNGATIKQTVASGKAVITEPPSLGSTAVALLKATGATEITQATLDALVTELQQLMEQSDQMTITLAGPPSGSLKKSLVAWCRKNIAPTIFVAFRFNATILGGMVVQYGSHVYDWSARRQILDNRARFAEVLRHV